MEKVVPGVLGHSKPGIQNVTSCPTLENGFDAFGTGGGLFEIGVAF